MPVSSSRVTVTTAATQLVAVVPSYNRVQSALVRNRAAVSVFIGGPGVTTGTGFELEPGDAATLDMNADDALWGIVATGTAEVAVLKVGD